MRFSHTTPSLGERLQPSQQQNNLLSWPFSIWLLIACETLFVLYQVRAWLALGNSRGLPMHHNGAAHQVDIFYWILWVNVLAVLGLWLSARSAARPRSGTMLCLALAVLLLLLSNNLWRVSRLFEPTPALAVIERDASGRYPETWADWEALERRWPGLRKEMRLDD